LFNAAGRVGEWFAARAIFQHQDNNVFDPFQRTGWHVPCVVELQEIILLELRTRRLIEWPP
jgi:hypothetical protein